MPDPQLRVRVSADTSDARRDIGGLEGSFTELNNMVGLLRQGIEIVGGLFKSTLQPIIDYGARVRELRDFTGDTAENVSAMIQVSSDFGVTSSELETALRKVVDNGLDPTLATLIDLSGQFLDVPQEERPDWLLENFGRAGQDMATLMAAGPDVLRGLAEGIGATALSLSDMDIDDINRLAESLNNWEQAMLAIKLSLVDTGVLDRLAGLITGVAGAMTALFAADWQAGADAAAAAINSFFAGVQIPWWLGGGVMGSSVGTYTPGKIPLQPAPGGGPGAGGGFTGGRKAAGGLLGPGWNLVGERGPEMISPTGHVTPVGNDALLEEVRRLRSDLGFLRTLPTMIRDAVERAG